MADDWHPVLVDPSRAASVVRFEARLFDGSVIYCYIIILCCNKYMTYMAKIKLIKAPNHSLAKSLKKRSGKKSQIILSFDSLVKKLHQIIETFPDNRIGKNLSKNFKDAALGGFAIFYTQSPSFLAYQKTMQEMRGKNNAHSLFGITEILSDNHIRSLLDEVSPSYIFPMFSYIFDSLDQSGYLDNEFRSFNKNFLIPLDGTQYFSSSSQTIHCRNCNQKHHKNGSITYFHSVVTPVLVKPGCNRAIALTPEFVTPQDGENKQDCENAAAKRWLRNHGDRLKQLGVTITGDDLYCKQPICELIKEKGLNFILTCKEESHKTLYEYVEYQQEDIQSKKVKRWTGKHYEVDTYRFINDVPLRDGEDALAVNWCEIITRKEEKEKETETEKEKEKEEEKEEESGALGDVGNVGGVGGVEGVEGVGKIIYKNAFITDFEITRENVKRIVADGRARWKVENENNNVLKTKGYHLEHNFGHGKKNLATLFATFNILAFLFHTVLEIMDDKYKLVRETLPARETFFQDLRALTRYIYFDSWETLMVFMIKGLKDQLHMLPLPDI